MRACAYVCVTRIAHACRASETLGGPLKYSLAMGIITALEWRTSVVGILAVLQVRERALDALLLLRQVAK